MRMPVQRPSSGRSFVGTIIQEHKYDNCHGSCRFSDVDFIAWNVLIQSCQYCFRAAEDRKGKMIVDSMRVNWG
jgi:hypothetical protein